MLMIVSQIFFKNFNVKNVYRISSYFYILYLLGVKTELFLSQRFGDIGEMKIKYVKLIVGLR